LRIVSHVMRMAHLRVSPMSPPCFCPVSEYRRRHFECQRNSCIVWSNLDFTTLQDALKILSNDLLRCFATPNHLFRCHKCYRSMMGLKLLSSSTSKEFPIVISRIWLFQCSLIGRSHVGCSSWWTSSQQAWSDRNAMIRLQPLT
jgi:hypothetical protein